MRLLSCERMNRIFQYTLPVVLTAFSLNAQGATPADDFAALTAHWNFDIGRNWHNMPFPYETEGSLAEEPVSGNHISFNPQRGVGAPDNSCWVSGRQYSGIRGCNAMVPTKPLVELNGSVSLSFWMKLYGQPNTRGIIGSEYNALWGAMNKKGQVGLRMRGREVVMTPEPINDTDWHHIVITRDETTGNVVLYLDGRQVSTGTTRKGKIDGHFTQFSTNNAALDQIHLFSKAISPETVTALYDNHAPQVFEQTYLVENGRPSVTGSVLHGFTYDVDDDNLRVARFTQPHHGKVRHLGDGRFEYTPDSTFNKEGKDIFHVEITDGRGGYACTNIMLHDSSHVPTPAVREFRYSGNLPDIPTGTGKQQRHRNPMAIRLGGKRPDLLVQADSRLWLFANESKKGKLLFAKPLIIRGTDGAEIETDGAAVLKDNKILVRRPDGTLSTATVMLKDVPHLQMGAPITDTDGNIFKCPSRHFVLVDWDHDHTPDLICGLNDGLYVYRGMSDTPDGLAFAPEPQPVYKRSYNIAPAVGDLNNDGMQDLLYGINWGTLHAWINSKEKPVITENDCFELRLRDEPVEKYLRNLNGAHTTVADFDGDGSADIILGGNAGRELSGALGISTDSWAGNLELIEKELYQGHEHDLGKLLEADNRKGLNRYRELMTGWIRWAVSRRTPAERRAAYDMLKAHVKKYPFLQRGRLNEAWVRSEKGKVIDYGNMHHVPGIFTMNWVVLDQLQPDSAAHRRDVADALGMKPGPDRDVYLDTGMPLADNNRCSTGQLYAIRDMLRYHANILFPDDHISISQHFDDGREAMCFIFNSNKNTFGMEVGNNIAEMHGDMVKLTEECFGKKGAANGDYFTFVLAHEVCHSLDAYVRGRANKDLTRRWGDQNFYAATNGGLCDDIVANETGWWDLNLTKERFRERGYWDGKNENWGTAWQEYWKKSPYRNKVFMRGDIDWFLGSQQETFATQANHHWARSESRLIGAILRYLQGYKSNINEVVFFLDVLSAGQNKLAMLHPWGEGNPPMVNFNPEYAWLTRNDKGYITDIRIGDRHYGFEVNENGRVTGLRTYPFADKIQAAAKAAK